MSHKHDKKAILFLIILTIVTLVAVVFVAVQAWNYIEDTVMESAQEAYDDFWAAQEAEDKKADKDDDEESYEIDLDDIMEGIAGMEQATGGTVGAESARTNFEAAEERVYDYADILTDEEEEKLSNYIATCEEEYSMDIVLLILNEDMEATGLDWEIAMKTRADSFYDDNKFGYNEVYGDGILLLDNWYGEQAGSWVTTAGDIWYSDDELNAIYDEMYAVINEDPCEAYRVFVEKACEYK